MMPETNEEKNGFFGEPMTEAEKKQVQFLFRFLIAFLTAIVIAVTVVYFVTTA